MMCTYVMSCTYVCSVIEGRLSLHILPSIAARYSAGTTPVSARTVASTWRSSGGSAGKLAHQHGIWDVLTVYSEEATLGDITKFLQVHVHVVDFRAYIRKNSLKYT